MSIRTLINLFRWKSGPGKPLTFLRGSEEELRSVTKWMCQANPSIFKQDRICISYSATDGKKAGEIQLIGAFQQMLSPREELYLTRSCQLIYKHNEFTGTEWFKDLNNRNPVLVSIFGFFEWPLDVTFLVDRPTDKEQHQALKAWSGWLDNKVSACEKQELLKLLDDVGGVSNAAMN